MAAAKALPKPTSKRPKIRSIQWRTPKIRFWIRGSPKNRLTAANHTTWASEMNSPYRGPSVEHYNQTTAQASYSFDESAEPDHGPVPSGGRGASSLPPAPTAEGSARVCAPPIQVIDLPPERQPAPPSRHGLLPLMRWIEVLPRFRANDRHHEIRLLPPPVRAVDVEGPGTRQSDAEDFCHPVSAHATNAPPAKQDGGRRYHRIHR